VVQPVDGVAGNAELTAELLALRRRPAGEVKLPRSIDCLDELPRDPNGKLYERKLRDPYRAGHGTPI
jgi:long-chain acyl-CoA synthetase